MTSSEAHNNELLLDYFCNKHQRNMLGSINYQQLNISMAIIYAKLPTINFSIDNNINYMQTVTRSNKNAKLVRSYMNVH